MFFGRNPFTVNITSDDTLGILRIRGIFITSKKGLKMRFSYIFIILIAIGSTLFSQPPQSPTDAEAVHRENLFERYRIERQIQQSRTQQPSVQITSPQPLPSDLDAKSNEKVFKLNDVTFDSQPKSISMAELRTITSQYISQELVSIRDLYEMLGKIDALFDAKHVVGRAVMPIQDVQQGVVHIQIIEGKLGKRIVEMKRQPYPLIEGTQKPLIPIFRPFGETFVRRQFRYPSGSVLNMQQLEDELLRYNRTYRNQLIAELEPGEDIGLSNLKLTSVLPQPISAGIFCDNSGRKSSGEIRTGTFVQTQSLFGLDESFFFNFDKTEGTKNYFISADMPISAWGTSAEFSYSFGEPKTIAGAFASLDINGESESYRPGLRQNLWNTKENKGSVFFGVESYNSVTHFGDIQNYREKLVAYTVGLDNLYRHNTITLFSTISSVFGNAGVAGNPAFGDYEYANFQLLRTNFTHVWNPNKNWTLISRVTGQLSLSPLPQSQVYQIGGMATIRGADEGLMSGDSGYLTSVEARRLLFEMSKEGRIETFGFFDHGTVFYRNSGDLRCSDSLFSVGGGLIFNYGKYASATIGAGLPIFTNESHQEAYKDVLSEGRGYFTVRLMF